MSASRQVLAVPTPEYWCPTCGNELDLKDFVIAATGPYCSAACEIIHQDDVSTVPSPSAYSAQNGGREYNSSESRQMPGWTRPAMVTLGSLLLLGTLLAYFGRLF